MRIYTPICTIHANYMLRIHVLLYNISDSTYIVNGKRKQDKWERGKRRVHIVFSVFRFSSEGGVRKILAIKESMAFCQAHRAYLYSAIAAAYCYM